MYYLTAQLPDHLPSHPLLKLPRILILGALLGIPTIALCTEGAGTADTTAEAGTVFRIEDYVPGTFESRLEYVSVNMRNIGEWNRLFNLAGRRLRLGPAPSPNYYLPSYDREERFARSLSVSGSYTRSRHYESPQRITDTKFTILGNYYPQKTTYNDDEPGLSFGGSGTASTGTSRFHSTHAELRYTGEYWKYLGNLWAFMLNPLIHLAAGGSESRLDVDRVHVLYSVTDTQELIDRVVNSRYQRNEGMNYSMEGGLDIAVGKGRVYDGTSSWRAIELIRTVAELSGRSVGDVSRDGMEQLAATLYELQSKKYPRWERSRLFEFERTERVAAQVEKALAMESLSPRAIAAIHDILKYYPQFTRSFGQRWYVLGGGRIVQNNSDRWHKEHSSDYDEIEEHYTRISRRRSESTTETRSAQVILGLAYHSYRPLTHQWQLNIHGSANYYEEFDQKRYRREYYEWRYWDSDTSEWTSISGDTVKCWRPRAGAALQSSMELVYIKDSRTWWEFRIQAELEGANGYAHPNIDPESMHRQTSQAWVGALQGRLDYHRSLAWKLYLTARFIYTASYGDVAYSRTTWADNKGGASRYYLNVSLEYYM